MNGNLVARTMLPGLVALSACGSSTASGTDPQAPNPSHTKTAAASVVICPDGSTYAPGQNACIATSGTPQKTPKGDSDKTPGEQAHVQISCSFRQGWAALVPVDDYPADDEFVMQALIGFTEQPDFWKDQNEYASLAEYAAKPCTRRGETFDVAPGAYFVLVGEAGTFGRRSTYQNNGYRERIRLSANESKDIDLSGDDLNHTWYCISCPHVSFYDPTLGRYLSSFVVLAYRDERRLEGTERIVVHDVPVHDGTIRLRVDEVEPETTYLDQFVIEVDGVRVLPRKGGPQSALASADQARVIMRQGTRIVVEYDVPHVRTGTATVTVVAHGYYEPDLP